MPNKENILPLFQNVFKKLVHGRFFLRMFSHKETTRKLPIVNTTELSTH